MRKLAIVGSNHLSRDNAPWSDLTYEIWVMNTAPMQDWCKRWDLLTQLHKPEIYTNADGISTGLDNWGFLQKQHGKPIYMQEVDPRVPDSVSYPLEEILTRLPWGMTDWMKFPEGSFSWIVASPIYLIALALYQHFVLRDPFETIEIYGCELVSNTEYTYQQDNFTFVVGMALGMRAPLKLRCSEKLFSGPLYGYQGEVELPADTYTRRVRELDPLWTQAEKALEDIQKQVGEAMQMRNYARVVELAPICETAALSSGEYAGRIAQACKYRDAERYIARHEFEYWMAAAQKDGDEKRVQMYRYGGVAEYIWHAWELTGSNEALKQLANWMKLQMQSAYDTGVQRGSYNENRLYMDQMDDLLTAAGGDKALRIVQANRITQAMVGAGV